MTEDAPVGTITIVPQGGLDFDIQIGRSNVTPNLIEVRGPQNDHDVSAPVNLDASYAIKTYLDGELHSQAELPDVYADIRQNDFDLAIGGQYGGSIRGWDGKIDEVRLWDRDLSSDEVQQFYNQTLTGTEDGLAFYLNFEGQAGQFKDQVSGALQSDEVSGVASSSDTPFAGGNQQSGDFDGLAPLRFSDAATP